jgi:hypothetical protein
MMQWLEAFMQMPKRRRMRCSFLLPLYYTCPEWAGELHSVVITRLFFLLVVFSLLLLSLLVTLLVFALELILPELVGGVAVDVREDDLEDVGVPRDRLALNAFFDVLADVSR